MSNEIEKIENNVVKAVPENDSDFNSLNVDNSDSFITTIDGCRFLVEDHFNQNTNMTLGDKRRKISNTAYEIPNITSDNGGVI